MRGLITPLITTDEPPSRASGSEIRAPRLYPGGWGFGLRMSFLGGSLGGVPFGSPIQYGTLIEGTLI